MRTAGRAESQLHESDRTRHWLRALAFVVPAAYCALAVILAPSDRLGAPSALNRTVSPGFSTKRLLYDDYDVTAMALRGLNTAARPQSRRVGMRPNAWARSSGLRSERRSAGALTIIFCRIPPRGAVAVSPRLSVGRSRSGAGASRAACSMPAYPDLVMYFAGDGRTNSTHGNKLQTGNESSIRVASDCLPDAAGARPAIRVRRSRPAPAVRPALGASFRRPCISP